VSCTVRALASPALAAGFRLAGLVVAEVPDLRLAGEQLLLAAARAGTGILLVEQSVYDAAPEAVRHDVSRRAVPIIVPVPSASWSAGGHGAEDFILDLLRRAIGYRVRLQ
jgi:vacuolar-type H+-ATPase subunit F/Vma7